MRPYPEQNRVWRAAASAYALAEVMVAVLLMGLLFFSLYAGFSSGFAVIKLARENLRATQIMVQRVETIRLYTWDQVTGLQQQFTERYDPQGGSGSGGAIYTCTLSPTVPPAGSLPEAYRTNMRLITITLYWTNSLGGTNRIVRKREMQTYVARQGMQHYIYYGN